MTDVIAPQTADSTSAGSGERPAGDHPAVSHGADVARLDIARPLVPSGREVELGASPPPVVSVVPPAAPVPASRRGTLRRYLRQLDYRDITDHGPALPLFLFGYFALIQGLDTQAYTLLFPEIKDSFGFSVGFLVLANSVISIVGALLAPAIGYAVDRWRRVTMLAVGTVISHASIALRGTAGSATAYVGYQALGGAGGSIGAPASFPLIADYYPPRSRARVFAFFAMGTALANIIAPIGAATVATAVGWRMTLVILGAAAAMFSLSFFFLREPVRGAQDRLAAGVDARTAVEAVQRPTSWGESWRAAAKIRTLRRVWMVTAPNTAVTTVLPILLGLYYVEHFHLDVVERGLLGSIAAVPVLLGLAFSGVVTDRLLADRPGRIMPVLSALSVCGFAGTLIIVYTPFLWLAVAISIVPAFFSAMVSPALTSIVTLVVPARMRGVGVQTTAPFQVIGLLAAGPLAALVDVYSLHTAILVMLAIQGMGAIVMGTAGGAVEEDIRNSLAASAADADARRGREAGSSRLLVCRSVKVGYDGAQVLFDVDFDVDEGEFVALLGTNGAGKSTLLRAISGIQEASGGAVFLDGEDITHVPPHEIALRGVVVMPGGQAVFPTLTVEENLRAAARLHRSDRRYVEAKTAEVLRRFPRLRERLRTRAGDLSGGEQQMVAVGQALLMKPRLLMIDELSLGLTPQVVQSLLDMLREIHRAGTTVLIVEQSVNVALQVAERAVYMEKGTIRFDGSVEDLRRRPDLVKSVFLGAAVTSSVLSQTTERRRMELAEVDHERVLEASDLRLSYGGVQVLDGVSLTLDRGEVVGIIGPNGAGKTSLFDALAGFAPIDGGTISLLGRDVTRLRADARARLGMARSYQNVRLFPALTVRENIAVALERHLRSRSAVMAGLWLPPARRSERRVTRRVDNLIESLGLVPFAEKFVNELSTGTRRIVDIACVLATRPRVLLLDEPSSGLAQAETEQLGPVIGRIVKETSCGLLVIEHDIGLVSSVSHRLVAMQLGAVMAQGLPVEVLETEKVIDALLGGASDAVVSRSVQVAPMGANQHHVESP